MVQTNTDRGKVSNDLDRQATRNRWVTAEKDVCKLLTPLLLDGYLILNDVPFPYGNLDHVVIRPDGCVFLVETKSHRGTVAWDGKRLLINKRRFSTNPICQVNRSIRWIRHMVKQVFGHNPWIVSVLVFPNATVTIRRSVKRVNVMTAKDLISFMRNYPTLAE